MKIYHISIIAFVLFIISVGCGEQSYSQSFYSDELVGSAWETHAEHIKAVNAKIEVNSEEIPSLYWADRIKALKPIKVYKHRTNIVIVQRIEKGIEFGKYVYIPISSYLPKTGVDGFVLEPNPERDKGYFLGNWIFEYTRVIFDCTNLMNGER